MRLNNFRVLLSCAVKTQGKESKTRIFFYRKEQTLTLKS